MAWRGLQNCLRTMGYGAHGRPNAAGATAFVHLNAYLHALLHALFNPLDFLGACMHSCMQACIRAGAH